jgi:hypothetical protein
MNAKIMKGILLEQQHLLAGLLGTMKKNLIAMDVVPGSNERRRGADGANRVGADHRPGKVRPKHAADSGSYDLA